MTPDAEKKVVTFLRFYLKSVTVVRPSFQIKRKEGEEKEINRIQRHSGDVCYVNYEASSKIRRLVDFFEKVDLWPYET